MRFCPFGALSALALLALPACAAEPPIEGYFGAYTWHSEAEAHGGFSGLEVSDDGQSFVAISDRGAITAGRFERREGRITGVRAGQLEPLTTPGGGAVEKHEWDAEGLAISPQGARVISYEGAARLWAYGARGATALPVPPAFESLQLNSGLEALAIDGEGTLYTLPERSGQLTRPFPVWRLKQGRWSQPFEIPRGEGFLPVGADFGPDGAFYLLEREFSGLAFRSRVRRFTFEGDTITSERVVFTSTYGTFDNLEGIAAWQDPGGQTVLTMISDDNFNILQRTEFVEIRVTE